MARLDSILAQAASSIAHPTRPQQEILARLNRLQARLEEGLLRVAVLGQFKRGKSTLLNALLGAPLLPTGVTPVTAIPTFIKAGPAAKARIAFKDKPVLLIPGMAEIAAALPRYISEAENPHNQLEVESVELEIGSAFLEQGFILVDTPGVGSTLRHNTQAAEAVLSECDVAVFVVSADPPITEAEIAYLHKIQELIPKIFFALNKKDLLSPSDESIAAGFLADVLRQQPTAAGRIRIFPVSAKQGLEAKLEGNSQGFEASGIKSLEQVLRQELSEEKSNIAFVTGRQRSIFLLGELLFQTEVEHKALLLPQENLERKAVAFETSAVRFENERETLSDLLSIDRKRLLGELEAETERIWRESQKRVHGLLGEITAGAFTAKGAREQVATMLSRSFEEIFRQSVDSFRAKLGERLAIHQDRAGALINLVRQTAAELMEITASLPGSGEAFEVRREPYWLAPEPSASLLGISADLIARLMPGSLRRRRELKQLFTESDAAVLRNVANLEWAIRQNIDDAFRRFEADLAEQLARALAATRDAMRIAIERRVSHANEVDEYVKESARSIAELSDLLENLKTTSADQPVSK